MKVQKIIEKNVKELNIDLLDLLHEQFNLRVQAKSGQLKQIKLLREIRRNIARIKTCLAKK